MDEFLTQSKSIYQLNLEGIERRIQERRLILSNGYDPYQESKYWEKYQKYKKINKEKYKGFLERQQKLKDFNSKLDAVTQEKHEIIDISNEFVEDIINEELGFTVEETDADKTLDNFIDDCIKQHPEFSILFDKSFSLGDKEPKCVKKFKDNFKNLLKKYVQIGVLNSANGDSKGIIKFMTAKPTKSLDIIDSFLSK